MSFELHGLSVHFGATRAVDDVTLSLAGGKRSALAVTIGMATRAPLTMFDEPHLGMDAPSRYAFYDELRSGPSGSPPAMPSST